MYIYSAGKCSVCRCDAFWAKIWCFMWTCNCCCRSLKDKGIIFSLKCSWNIVGGLCWKTLSHSCPAVTTSVSLRDQSLSNITYSRQDTKPEAQMIETCLETCSMDWILCHNIPASYLTGLYFLFVSDCVCVLLVSSPQLLTTPMTPGTGWFWICQAGIGQVSWHTVLRMPNIIIHPQFSETKWPLRIEMKCFLQGVLKCRKTKKILK